MTCHRCRWVGCSSGAFMAQPVCGCSSDMRLPACACPPRPSSPCLTLPAPLGAPAALNPVLKYFAREFGNELGEEKMRSVIGRFGITGPQQVRAFTRRAWHLPPARSSAARAAPGAPALLSSPLLSVLPLAAPPSTPLVWSREEGSLQRLEAPYCLAGWLAAHPLIAGHNQPAHSISASIHISLAISAPPAKTLLSPPCLADAGDEQAERWAQVAGGVCMASAPHAAHAAAG